MSKKTIIEKPIPFIVNAIEGFGQTRLGKWLTGMSQLDPTAPQQVAMEIAKRNDAPRVVQMPGWALLHFDQKGRYPAKAFSSIDKLNPQVLQLENNQVAYAFRNREAARSWVAHPAGLTKTGKLCHRGGCVPRAIAGASGGRATYDDVVIDLQNSFENPFVAHNRSYFSFENGNSPNTQQIEQYLNSQYEEPFNGLDITDFYALSIPYPLREKRQSIAAKAKLLSQIRNYPAAVAVVDNMGQRGHAVGYLGGLQIRQDPMDAYTPATITRIHDIYVRKPGEVNIWESQTR